MITVISAFIGLLPHILKYFQAYQDNKQEMAILQLQYQMLQAGYKTQLQEVALNTQSQNIIALNQTSKTNIVWIDSVNGFIRPLIALVFTLKMLLSMAYPEHMVLVDHDYAIYSCILSFYFGGLVQYK